MGPGWRSKLGRNLYVDLQLNTKLMRSLREWAKIEAQLRKKVVARYPIISRAETSSSVQKEAALSEWWEFWGVNLGRNIFIIRIPDSLGKADWPSEAPSHVRNRKEGGTLLPRICTWWGESRTRSKDFRRQVRWRIRERRKNREMFQSLVCNL